MKKIPTCYLNASQKLSSAQVNNVPPLKIDTFLKIDTYRHLSKQNEALHPLPNTTIFMEVIWKSSFIYIFLWGYEYHSLPVKMNDE